METYLFCKKSLNKCGTTYRNTLWVVDDKKVHPAVSLGEQVFLADFSFILPIMLILKVLMEFVCISGVIILTDRTHQTHLVVHLE